MQAKLLGIIASVLAAGLILLATCGLKTREAGNPGPAENIGGQVTPPPMPDTVSFMGESVPLDRFDVYESLERELLVNTFFHSQTIRFIKMAPRYFSIIDPILEKEGLPGDFRYLMVAESNLDPRALSPAGAAGMWQFMKSTAVEYGLEVNSGVDERYHIEKSTTAACRYLKKSWNKYHNWGLVAAGYNAGNGAVDKQIARQKVSSYFDLLMSEETERYIYRIISLKMILENPEKYGFRIAGNEKYPLWTTHKVEIRGSINSMTDFARNNGITYKTLKYYNPWLRDTLLSNKAGKVYYVDVPEN